MNKLKLFVCEKFFMEYEKILEDEGIEDAIVIPFSCVCENPDQKNKVGQLLRENNQGILFCGNRCQVKSLFPEGSSIELREFDNCFNYMANDSMINYLTESSGFVIGLGWLKNWRQNLLDKGFSKETAEAYYKGLYKKIVFFDAGIDLKAEKDLIELAEFLKLPYAIVPIELETLKLVLMNEIYRWRLDRLSGDNGFDKRIRDLQAQCNGYSSILDVVGKITVLTNKREAIEKIIELYQIVFGARQIKYWSCDFEKEHIPDDIAGFFSCVNNHLFFHDENRFCVKVQWNDKLYGALEFRDFANPQHTVRYLSYAIEIVKICGVVFANIDQYELLIKSQKEVKYAGYHDPLTGLYNRTYLNVLLEREEDDYDMTVFLFEIDKLKTINDGFGHTEGDKLIKIAAESLRRSFRETDYLLRSGGDEFIAILPQADQKTADAVKKRIEEELAAQNSSGIPSHLKVKLSMGYATTDENYDTLSDLIHLADERMCAEKQKKA